MKFNWTLVIIKLILVVVGGMLIGSFTVTCGVLFVMWGDSINETGK